MLFCINNMRDRRRERTAQNQHLRNPNRRDKDGQADQHADRRQAESVVPAVFIADIPAHQSGAIVAPRLMPM